MKEDIKVIILDNAQNLFLKYGVSETGVADIANAVGISKGTLYYHFKSKNAIIDAVADRYFERMDNLFITYLKNAKVILNVGEFVDGIVDIIKNNLETEMLHYVLLAYGVIKYDDLKAKFRVKYNEWLSLIRLGLDKIAKSENNEVYSRLIFASIEGMIIRNILGMDNISVDKDKVNMIVKSLVMR